MVITCFKLNPLHTRMPSLVEIGPVILKKKIFKFRQFVIAISFLSPLGKGLDPSFLYTNMRNVSIRKIRFL